MPESVYYKLQLIPGTYDYVADGELVANVQSRIIYVESQSDLAGLPDYAPGTMAATYGLGHVYQKSPSGTWTEIT